MSLMVLQPIGWITQYTNTIESNTIQY